MKISLEWLTEFIDWIETDPMVIAERLTVSSAEVEDVERQGALLGKCCVGKVLSIAKHPNADKLSLVDVQTDDGVKRVVCGGTNLKLGMLVAFAHVGATVKWHGGELMTLAPVKIRGEESHGMICAAEELGLENMLSSKSEDEERPIVELQSPLSSKLQAGAPLREALHLTDTILHVSNKAIPHRPDLFSHIGFARECVALGLAAWKKEQPMKIAFPKVKCPVRCTVQDEAAVPRYCAALLEIDALGDTPQWMRRRLEATGWRCVSTPVDITNYVAMELGMPLHSFDADDLVGDLVIRRSNAGEMITSPRKSCPTSPPHSITT
jgi:phenylalanyl-tRNA synthetase beta chain